MSRKKRVLFHSNNTKAFTGFGKNAKNLLRYLYLTDKYELLELANGTVEGAPELEKKPWKSTGGVPNNPQRMQEINQDPNLARKAGYGHERIDQVIKDFQPDIYLGVEDIWAFEGFWDKKWWDKITSMVWTTLDSLPILPIAEENASKIKNYYIWASFGAKALNELGHSHVKNLKGSLETDNFFRFDDNSRAELRRRFNVNQDNFIIGFVFRNQLRKSVPNLLNGFTAFQKQNPESKAKLLLHTHWSEGWDIPRLLKENNINPADVLTTYFCARCNNYEIKPFSGQEQNCRFCGAEKSQNTTNVQAGVSESQLNEIYNLMDVYCHPFTSGGQEIPVQEAKLTELVTLVTNYSCGEDCCTSESGGFPLEWAEYREPGTQFIKASTYPSSISKQLVKVYKMKPAKRAELGKRARQFVINNYSVDIIGPKLEKIFDEAPYCKWDFDFSEAPKNPTYQPPQIEDNKDWLKDIYLNILNMQVKDEDDGLSHWMKKLTEGMSRELILDYFRKVASDDNQKLEVTTLEDLLDDDEGKRILYVMPKSIGDVFWSTSLMPSIAKTYPDHNIYFATDPKYFEILENNPYIYKVIPYNQQMDNLLILEGQGRHKGFFDIAFLPHVGTQRILNYLHNGKDKIQLDIRNEEVFANINRGAFG